MKPESQLVPRHCSAITRAGKKCAAKPLVGTDRCLLHTGNNPSLLGLVGGKRRALFHPEGLVVFEIPENTADMRKILGSMVIEMRNGNIEPRLATQIAFVCQVFLKASENEVIDKVVAELEELKRKVNGTQ